MCKLLLVGQGITAESAIESLLACGTVVGLVRAEAGSAGRADPAVACAGRHGVPVCRDTSIAAIRDLAARLDPDCVVVSSYDRVLPADLIASRPFVNVHYAPLPRYRGRANVNWAIINEEPRAGIAIHVLAPQLDAGHILFERRIPIGPDETVTDLYERLNALQREHLGPTVARFLDGATGYPQDPALVTYGCTRLPMDGEIDWSQPTRRVAALVRGLTPPFPGAFTWLDGQRLVIRQARPVGDAPIYEGRVPGRVVAVSRTDGTVDVLTGDGILRLLAVERGGGGPVPAAAVIRSVKATLGLRTADLLARIEQLERDLADLRARIVTGDPHHALV